MEKSEINSALDISYSELKNIGDVLPKEHKGIVLDAATSLRAAIETSEAVTLAPHAPFKHTEGSDTQKEIAYRKIKEIGDKISACSKEVNDDMKEDMENAVTFINVVLDKEKERKEIVAVELAKKEALKNPPEPKVEETPVTETGTGASTEDAGSGAAEVAGTAEEKKEEGAGNASEEVK